MTNLKNLLKDVSYFGNAILNLIYFRIFYTKLNSGILHKMDKLRAIDPNWESDVPQSFEEYLDLLIDLKLNGIKTKIK